jgi:abortive infection bacteriophage resistance protein
MTKRPYNKPPTTYPQQIDLLRARGMRIDDPDTAAFYLRHLNYYRLAAYWLPFESDHATHTFRPGTRFEDVLDLYVFDRELRLLIMDAVERIEVSVRGQWAHILAHRHGPHAHLDAALARNPQRWADHLAKLRDEVARSKEAFIQHHRETYQEELPPVWVVSEVLSLGLLSRLYENIGFPDTKAAIAGQYGLHQRIFTSWLHQLSVVRNICAHHGRLWNRHLLKLEAPHKHPAALAGLFVADSPKLYNTLLLLLYLMDVISPGHHWRQRLLHLLTAHPAVPLAAMGFPAEWQRSAIWQSAGAL